MREESSIIQLRIANIADCDRLFEWRNDPAARKNSFNVEELVYEDHCVWFSNAIAEVGRIFYIGETGGNAFGVVSYRASENQDVHDGATGREIIVSVNLDPAVRGERLACPLLVKADRMVMSHCLSENSGQFSASSKIVAIVKKTNTASLRTFASAGYQADEEEQSSTAIKFVKEM